MKLLYINNEDFDMIVPCLRIPSFTLYDEDVYAPIDNDFDDFDYHHPSD